MARWEPNAQERLVRAALELFTEQGYDATTVNEIADRAGLTKTTFFRHFRDKREVLFAGQDTHTRLLADAIAAAPGPATPLE
ncbi:helix-turn-helix transcriptional regulator, partial [Streptomyces albiflaviniger]|nr:helix-turn-helix transcriptional regulator [Streptomyces albiflaviniger]